MSCMELDITIMLWYVMHGAGCNPYAVLYHVWSWAYYNCMYMYCIELDITIILQYVMYGAGYNCYAVLCHV